MNKNKYVITTGLVLLVCLIGFVGIGIGQQSSMIVSTATAMDDDHANEQGHDADEDGHDHESETHEDHDQDLEENNDEDDHEGHGHEEAAQVEDDHEGHDEAEEDGMASKDEMQEKFGIQLAIAIAGTLETQRTFPGEIMINEDNMAHIVPRAPGIVREVIVSVGDVVKTGEVMAWIESAELGEAKVDYLSKYIELGCCIIDLKRAVEIQENTSKLLDYLKDQPPLGKLRQFDGHNLGDNRSIIINAYAEYRFAKETHDREKQLHEKKISSRNELLIAESNFKKAEATYAATRDTISFSVQRDLLEERSTHRRRVIELVAAERRLLVMGLTDEEIAELNQVDISTTPLSEKKTHACTDPNCTACDEGAHDETPMGNILGRYPLRAPFDAMVIEKHITLGEKISDDTNAFAVADLDSVWVDMSIYQRDLVHVSKGQVLNITIPNSREIVKGEIQFVSPVVDRESRTVLARMVLPNSQGLLRPGLFIKATLSMSSSGETVVISNTAIQSMDGESVVFVESSKGFEPLPIQVGRTNGEQSEILKGLKPGLRYVESGAFELKAEIITSGLDPHAGHGH